MSNLSDISGNTAVPAAAAGVSHAARPRMDIAVVIDCEKSANLSHRKAALEEVRQACGLVGANLQQIQFEVLDYGDRDILEYFYNADVVVVDLSVQTQQSTLCYHLGVRESFQMNENIVIYNDTQDEATLRMKISCGNYQFISYQLHEHGSVIITSPLKATAGETAQQATQQSAVSTVPQPVTTTLVAALRRLFQDVEIQSKAHLREKFLADLRSLRDQHAGNVEELQRMLRNMRKRLDDPHVLSKEIVQTYMLSLRDVQDYDAMVQLVDDLQTIPNKQNYINTGHMHYLYAFALNRRNHEGDRERALRTCTKALEKKENHFPDMLCLYGRIYKDIFVESNHTDRESLKNAIIWYRKSFEVQPNEFAGINLATLLVIDGKDFTDSELQHIGMKLNNLIGKKGSLSQIKDYWNVATFFEISVLAENYAKAIQAAECMFKLRPPKWYLKSTIGNIMLIDRARKRADEAAGLSIEQQIFQFWMEFFLEATAREPSSMVRFPILILEPQKIYMPSYVSIHMDAEQKSIDISNICQQHDKGSCLKLHDFNFLASQIKSVSLYKRDERCAYLYVHHNSDDFQMFFPSVQCRQTFYDLILQMTADQGSGFIDLSSAETTADELKYEYEVDDEGQRILLGKGTYGAVYAARDLTTQVKIAVKEVYERNTHDVQPLHEEIKLHSQLRHRNIVQYWGSKSENQYFKIFMEQAAMFKVGFYKTHPTIPEELSTVAKNFILRCFEVNVDKRATAAELLEDPFLCEKHKKMRPSFSSSSTISGLPQPTAACEFNRSVSMPADRQNAKTLTSQQSSASCNTPTFSSETEPLSKPPLNATIGVQTASRSVTERKNKHSFQLTPIKLPNHGVNSIGNLAETPSLEMDPAEQTSTVFQLNRRSSSGGLLSPEIDITTGTASKLPLVGEANESDGFYLLKKDSQRRQTLDKVLCHDVTKICELWLTKIEPDANQKLAITRDHLVMLLNGLRKYIAEQRTDTLEQAIAQLKMQPNFNATAIVQLHLALYAFQNTVITVLRSHNIKPHWMFALENLVKSAVHAGITILSPKLGANLAGNAPNDDEYDEESNELAVPAVRTVVNGRVANHDYHHQNHSARDERDGPVDDCEYDAYDLMEGGGEDEEYPMDELDDALAGASGHGPLHRCTKPRARSHGTDAGPGTPLQKKTRWKTLHEQVETLRAENQRLKEYLLESQQSYQSAFRAVLENGAFARCLTDQLVALMERCLHEHGAGPADLGDAATVPAGEGRVRSAPLWSKVAGRTAAATVVTNSPKQRQEEKGEEEEEEEEDDDEVMGDRRLAEWLQAHGIKRPECQRRILREGFLYDDFLYELERDDLRRLGLKIGEELRIWNALKRHRRLYPPKRALAGDDDTDWHHNNCLHDNHTAGIDAR
uniref:Protein kinase domain-containing protein n=1 Tax=Anopheles epiroticus TaxID=199890 RepID=A0A182PTE7_9DIPT